jgi:hypothetical protein
MKNPHGQTKWSTNSKQNLGFGFSEFIFYTHRDRQRPIIALLPFLNIKKRREIYNLR